MEVMVALFPHINASLNLVAAVLLVLGFVLIKRKKEEAHKRVMLGCFGVSVLFLICYLTYHAMAGSRPFPRDQYPQAYWVYLPILVTHIIFAAVVPVLALTTIYFGLRDQRSRHRRVARWTFPIWLYTSVTGVLVYVMLYWLFPVQESIG